jgi:hypothetical protein
MPLPIPSNASCGSLANLLLREEGQLGRNDGLSEASIDDCQWKAAWLQVLNVRTNLLFVLDRHPDDGLPWPMLFALASNSGALTP